MLKFYCAFWKPIELSGKPRKSKKNVRKYEKIFKNSLNFIENSIKFGKIWRIVKKITKF